MNKTIKTLGSLVIIINVFAFAVHAYFGNFYQITKPSQTPSTSSKKIVMETNKEMKENHYSDSIVYGDWGVSKIGDMILYISHGNIVHGHKFGWIKKKGRCNDDFLYLTFSTYHESKELFDELKKQRVGLTLSFPEVEGVSNIINPMIVSSNNLGNMKIITLSNVNKDKVLGLYMQKLAKIDIIINAPFNRLFDIPNETWSLKGYIAAELKAREICEALLSEKDFI